MSGKTEPPPDAPAARKMSSFLQTRLHSPDFRALEFGSITMIQEFSDLILQPRINARVLDIVNSLMDDEQLALLVVRQINPYFVFSQKQEAKLRGIDPKTLRGMKQRGEIGKEVNTDSSQSLPKNGAELPKFPLSPGPSPKKV